MTDKFTISLTFLQIEEQSACAPGHGQPQSGGGKIIGDGFPAIPYP